MSISPPVSPTTVTANDGSNAWYRVTFTGPASFINAPCNLLVNLGGDPGPVFDIHPGAFDSSAAAQGVTFWGSPTPLAFGGSQVYYIRVYDPLPGAVSLRLFVLRVSTT